MTQPEAVHGSCHCGDVRFRVANKFTETTTCDCSLCVKKNAHMVKTHEDQLILETGWDKLSLYQWNTQIAKHYFCKQCGIYVFHRKRAEPDHFGINIYCLEDFDATALPNRRTSGAGMTLVENPEGNSATDPEPDRS